MTTRCLLVAALALALTTTTVSAAQAKPSRGELEKQIDKASNQLEDVVESYNKMKLDLKATEGAESKLNASMKPAQDRLAAASAQLGVIAASAYKSGQLSTVNAVLGDAGDLVDRLGLLAVLSRDRQRQVDQFTASHQTYLQTKAGLETTQQKQAAQVSQLAGRKKKIEADLKKLYAMRTAAYGSPSETGVKYTGKVPKIAGSAGKAVAFAFAQIGKPYVYGADGPDSYDCSGLTLAAWHAAGRSLPHNAAAQWSAVSHISRAELQEGDLVFYRNLGHVGIYVGGNQIIDASRAGKPVTKRTINIMTPYGYGRVT
jgi:cell wall-associated NlpC family hydrolase